MDPVTDYALQRFVASRADIFGQQASFVCFKSEPQYRACDGFKSTAVYGRIVYQKGDDAFVSPPMFLKTLSTTYVVCDVPTHVEFANEIFFYTQVLPFFSLYRHLGHLFPRYFTSHQSVTSTAFAGCMLFENLQGAGYVPSQRKSCLDYEHLALMMRKLGEFHAHSYAAKKNNPNHFAALADSFNQLFLFRGDAFRNVVPTLARRGLHPLRSAPRYVEKVPELERLMESGYEAFKKARLEEANSTSVLCHGDYVRDNVLFKYEQDRPVEMKMVDMASCVLASPVVDLASVLYLSADQRMRTDHWNELIDEYYTALSTTFQDNEVPSKESIMAEFRGRIFFVYFVASFYLDTAIIDDNKLPTVEDLTPVEFRRCKYMPSEIRLQISLTCGGDLFTQALVDILRDMIDREYV